MSENTQHNEHPKRPDPKYRVDIDVILRGRRSFVLGIYNEDRDGVDVVDCCLECVSTFCPWNDVIQWRY